MTQCHITILHWGTYNFHVKRLCGGFAAPLYRFAPHTDGKQPDCDGTTGVSLASAFPDRQPIVLLIGR